MNKIFSEFLRLGWTARQMEHIHDLKEQLEELQLSDEWIAKREFFDDDRCRVIYVDELRNLIVEQPGLFSEEWHNLIYKQLKGYSSLSERSFDFYWNAIANDVDIDDLINVARKDEAIVKKPEIPQFIENTMVRHDSLQEMLIEEYYSGSAGEIDDDEVFQWIDENFELLVKAWLFGYTAKKEPKYRVMAGNTTLLGKVNGLVLTTVEILEYYPEYTTTFDLTEQEIKDYDPRYWAFRREVKNEVSLL